MMSPDNITCLITSVPIEGESIEIEFVSDPHNLASNINFVLQQSNLRVRQINTMILEDMDVVHTLTPGQYTALLDILDTQFPYTLSNPPVSYTSNSTRILVRKMTNHAEQMALHASGKMTGNQLLDTLHQFLSVTSERMMATNIHDMDAHDLLKKQTPEDQMILQMVLDTLYGRMKPEVAANRLQAYAEDKQLSLPFGDNNVNAV